MSTLLSSIIPALQTISILGDTNRFINWLGENHPTVNTTYLFDGFQFSIVCCLNTFIYGIEVDQSLGLESDLYFQRAAESKIPLVELQLTCPKAFFLFNLQPYIKAITRAQNYKSLQDALLTLKGLIIDPFDYIFQNYLEIKSKNIDKANAQNLSLINFVHTHLLQIGNNGPYANSLNTLSAQWLKEERLDHLLTGYKYAIQFLWHELLGSEFFHSTHLSFLHKVDSWRNYKLNSTQDHNDELFPLKRDSFNLEEQNCLDSHFYWIQKEVTNKLEVKFGLPIYSINQYLSIRKSKEDFCKYFKNLSQMPHTRPMPTLSPEQKITEALYWYPFEIVDTTRNDLFFGASAFNTMLIGTATLFNSEQSELPKVIVARFIHPHKEMGKYDYSYGILIDTKSASYHYHCGWIIYKDVCGNYSGFSNGEREKMEEIITTYSNEGTVEVRDLRISMKDFERFLVQYAHREEIMDIKEENRQLRNSIQILKSNYFELFTYQTFHNHFGNEFKYQLNAGQKSPEGEKDIVLLNNEKVILVECKLNVRNYDIQTIKEKLDKKIAVYNQRVKEYQLWVWEELTIKSKMELEKYDIKVVSVSGNPEEPMLKGLDLNKMKQIMSCNLNNWFIN